MVSSETTRSRLHFHIKSRQQMTNAIRDIFCLLLLLSCSGCLALVAGAAGGTAGTVYVMGKLQDEIQAKVPAVHKATVAGIKDMSLPVTEDKGDQLTAHVESEFSDGKKVWIDLDSVAETHTKISIRVGIMGDEDRSRKILAAIKAHL